MLLQVSVSTGGGGYCYANVTLGCSGVSARHIPGLRQHNCLVRFTTMSWFKLKYDPFWQKTLKRNLSSVRCQQLQLLLYQKQTSLNVDASVERSLDFPSCPLSSPAWFRKEKTQVREMRMQIRDMGCTPGILPFEVR